MRDAMSSPADDTPEPDAPPRLLLWLLVLALLVFAAGAGLLGRVVPTGPLALVAALAAALIVALAVLSERAWWPGLRRHAVACGAAVDALSPRHAPARIALAAGASLVAELLLIRWQASSFQLFSYFKNVSLLAAFLGLGLGYAAAARPLLISAALPLLALQVVALRLLGLAPLHGLLQSPIPEQAGLGLAAERQAGHWLLTYGLLVAVYVASVLACIPLGQLAGRAMRGLGPLRAYGWNLAGSLLAVGLFAGLSAAWTPPAVWFSALLLLLLPFLAAGPRSGLVAAVVSLAAACGALSLPLELGATDHYSPYQVVTVRQRPRMLSLESSRSYFQQIWDLAPGRVIPGTELVGAYYELPYLFRPTPRRVLVVGSGAGNDVAAGLRRGAEQIDAVEIDPLILRLGQRLHPERPYASPRVRSIVEDARSYLRHTAERYDLIVYGLLDSHTVLAGSSSVRLDSYVYTVEALREARARLADDGVLVMSFTLLSREIAWKLFLMLREAFGQDPRAYQTLYDGGLTFVVGPGLAGLAPQTPFEEVSAGMRAAGLQADPSTDDWPFLYMAQRRLPASYVLMAVGLLALSWAAVRASAPPAARRFSAVAFGLGAGFMLVETKAITELALVYGSTWHVTSAVIAGVLVMALLANLWVARGQPAPALVYPLLLASVGLGLLGPAGGAGAPPALERALATALATLPLFFSGLAFSGELRRSGDTAAMLSSNLLGAIAGGLLEYSCMYLGMRRLTLLAVAVYAGAWWASRLARQAPAA